MRTGPCPALAAGLRIVVPGDDLELDLPRSLSCLVNGLPAGGAERVPVRPPDGAEGPVGGGVFPVTIAQIPPAKRRPALSPFLAGCLQVKTPG